MKLSRIAAALLALVALAAPAQAQLKPTAPSIGAVPMSSVGQPGGVASYGDSRITGALQAAGGDASGTNVTATGESAALSLAARAAQTANAATLGLSGALNSANGRLVRVPSATYPLTSDFTPAAADQFVQIDPGASFSGGGKLRLENLVPYQIAPIFSNDLVSKTYGSAYAGYGNIFARGAYANAAVANVPVVAQFGEGTCTTNPSFCWGGNHVGVAVVSGATAIAEELDAVALAAGAKAYGLVIAAAGPSNAQAGVTIQPITAGQLQANTAQSSFINGWVFNSNAIQAVTDDLVQSSVATAAKRALNFQGSYSVAEAVFPSFSIGATPAGINSGIAVQGDAGGNPGLAAVGKGSSPAANDNLNFYALGKNSGAVQLIVGGTQPFSGGLGLAIRPPATGTINSGVLVQTSPNGNPGLSPLSTGSGVTNANFALTALGTGKVVMGSPMQLALYTAAALPSCTATYQYSEAVVTDLASAPTYRQTITSSSGGGSIQSPVYCDASAWTAH